MHYGFKLRLIPTKEQQDYFWKAANASRYVYNWSLETNTKAYNEQNNHISGYDMQKLLVQLKKQEEYSWLNEIHCEALRRAVLDCDSAFKRFFKGQSRYPKYKSKKTATPSFSINTEISKHKRYYKTTLYNKIQFNHNNQVRLDGIGWVQLCKSAKQSNLWYLTENNINIYNGRVKFDGVYWNLSFSVDVPSKTVETTDEIIGIDLGIKDTAICSNEIVYKNINKTSSHIKKLEKRKKRYQRQISRKYEKNKVKNPETNRYNYVKTNNIKKLEKKTAKIDRTLKNIRTTYNHQISREIVNRKPKAIIMENLNIQGMMKNKHLSKAIKQQNLYQLKSFIQYKAENQGTKFVEVPRNYKSTQLCSKCGAVHKISLSQRTYHCPTCGHTEDRDLNASHNLQNYGKSLLLA